MICVLSGGVGAARLLTGLVQVVPPAEVVAVVNTADDLVLHGLYISPDLDTVTYTLAGAHNTDTGWGLASETWEAMNALERLGGAAWFRLGDRDLGTHLYRTGRLAEGAGLAEVTSEIVAAFKLDVRLLPMTEDPVTTRVTLAEGSQAGIEIGFQEWFVGLGHEIAVSKVRFDGISLASPGPGVLEAITEAEVVVIAPSNPVVSIGPLLAVPGIGEALQARRGTNVAVSPIVAGAALKGPADSLMRDLGHEVSAVGVAGLYRNVAATLVIDRVDSDLAKAVKSVGMDCVVTNTVMTNPTVSAALAETILEAVR